MSTFSNGLTKAQEERLQCLAEEAGEVVQECMKALRHGLDSHHPQEPEQPNRFRIAKELGNLVFSIQKLVEAGDILDEDIQVGYEAKKPNWARYTHHQPESLEDIMNFDGRPGAL